MCHKSCLTRQSLGQFQAVVQHLITWSKDRILKLLAGRTGKGLSLLRESRQSSRINIWKIRLFWRINLLLNQIVPCYRVNIFLELTLEAGSQQPGD